MYLLYPVKNGLSKFGFMVIGHTKSFSKILLWPPVANGLLQLVSSSLNLWFGIGSSVISFQIFYKSENAPLQDLYKEQGL